MSFDVHLTFAILYEPNRSNCKLVTKVICSFNYFPLLYFKAHSYDNLKQLMVVFCMTCLSPSYVTLVESSHAHMTRKITAYFSSLYLKREE